MRRLNKRDFLSLQNSPINNLNERKKSMFNELEVNTAIIKNTLDTNDKLLKAMGNISEDEKSESNDDPIHQDDLKSQRCLSQRSSPKPTTKMTGSLEEIKSNITTTAQGSILTTL